MSKVLKLVFDTEESVKNIIITNPKEDVSSEECKLQCKLSLKAVHLKV